MNAVKTIPVYVVALGTIALLLIPFIAMQFTSEVQWSLFDFLLMGAILFTIGMAFRFLIGRSGKLSYRLGVALAVGTTFFMIWANLAVGLIGAGANAGNLMYGGVLLVGIVSVFVSGFTPRGMERAMYVVLAALVVHTIVALGAGMADYPSSSTVEILGVNGFFVFFYTLAAMFFRFTSLHSSEQA